MVSFRHFGAHSWSRTSGVLPRCHTRHCDASLSKHRMRCAEVWLDELCGIMRILLRSVTIQSGARGTSTHKSGQRYWIFAPRVRNANLVWVVDLIATHELAECRILIVLSFCGRLEPIVRRFVVHGAGHPYLLSAVGCDNR